MSNNFVVSAGRDLYFFYLSQGSLKYRIRREGRLLPEEVVNSNANEKLPLSGLYPIYQDGVLLTPMQEDGRCVLYNGHKDEEPCLLRRIRDTFGEWWDPELLDHFKPFSFSPYAPYVAQATGPGHVVLFYQINSPNCQVGYREITENRTGAFQRFLNTSGNLVDASFLTTYDELHVLMVVKNALSCQLLYRKKAEDEFSESLLLWEAPRIEQCLLTIVETSTGSELHATCMIGGKLNRFVSRDEGETFGAMELYKRKFCAEPVKAEFIGGDKAKGWFARQVYVDRDVPWDLQMISDLVG